MATDTLGVPLLKEEIKSIWEEQQKHVSCIQDPTGVEVYTVTGHILKGGGDATSAKVCTWLHIARELSPASSPEVLLEPSTFRHTSLMESRDGMQCTPL